MPIDMDQGEQHVTLIQGLLQFIVPRLAWNDARLIQKRDTFAKFLFQNPAQDQRFIPRLGSSIIDEYRFV